VFVALSLGEARQLPHCHAGGVALAHSGARRAVDTVHKMPLQGARPVREPTLGNKAAEAIEERQLVLVIPGDRDVQGID